MTAGLAGVDAVPQSYVTHSSRMTGRSGVAGSWTGAPDNPSAASAIGAMTRVIGAASAHGVRGRTSCKRQVSGSNPLTGSRSGNLAPGEELPSITELSALQGIGTGVIRRALETLAADGLIIARRGQTPIVAGTPASTLLGARKRPGSGRDCRRAGCRPHVCHPMKASTIRGIHSILSGAFAAARQLLGDVGAPGARLQARERYEFSGDPPGG